MSKHTPGRWTVSEIDLTGEISEHYIFIEPNVAVIERKVDGQDLCDMADARLIAAAPAMLEALEALCADELLTQDKWDNARAAIKAAKGE